MFKDHNGIYSIEGPTKGPHTVISGGIHGNERTGVEVIQYLQSHLRPCDVQGTITLLFGNPKAYGKNVRYIDTDLNRLWSPDWIKYLKAKKTSELNIEKSRMLELLPHLQKVDHLLDLHETIQPSQPFIYCEGTIKHLQMAQGFQTPYIFFPSQSEDMTITASFDNFGDHQGGIGLTYEMGWLEDKKSIAPLISKIQHYLTLTGNLSNNSPLLAGTQGGNTEYLMIYEEVIAPSDDFQFIQPYHNFDPLPKGKIWAICGDQSFKTNRDSWIIFPKKDIKAGSPAAYLAQLMPAS